MAAYLCVPTQHQSDSREAYRETSPLPQHHALFPKAAEVPGRIVAHLRSRLGLGEDVSAEAPPRSRQRNRDAIREHLGVKRYGDEARGVAAEAVSEAALTMDDPADLVNVAVEELVKERFELPAFSTLDRLARKARQPANSALFAGVDGRLADAGRAMLDGVLAADERGRSELGLLKAPPKSATRKNLSELQEVLLRLESFGDTTRLLSGVPNQKVAHFAAQARALDASELKRIGDGRRRAMLVCLVHRAKVTVRDGLTEMLVKTMGRAHDGAKEDLETWRREKRATTERLIGVLEKILVGAKDPEGNDAALGRRVREVLAAGGGADLLLEASVSLSSHGGGNYLPLLWKPSRGKRAVSSIGAKTYGKQRL